MNVCGEARGMNNIEIEEKRKVLWQEYLECVRTDAKRLKEVDDQLMTIIGTDGKEISMKYGMKIIGEPGEDGYPLYIALHGGGQGDTPDLNDQQWEHMGIYYAEGVKSGIYVNPRGIRDTWDCHGNPESYYFYDRLITNMIAFKNVDPNRVYLMGFSAGGDGVYMITPKMADRFAAVHMSAGHPNGISLINLFNTPIQLQVGMNDDAFDRNHVTVEYEQYLDRLEKESNENGMNETAKEYKHNCFVHIDKPHNFLDHGFVDQKVIADNAEWLKSGKITEKLADTNAVHFLEKYVRNPLPEHIIWDLTCRADYRIYKNFYWLSIDETVKEGVIDANIRNNDIYILPETTVKEGFKVLVNEKMININKPVVVHYPDGEIKKTSIEVSFDLMKKTMEQSGDYNYSFIDEIDI